MTFFRRRGQARVLSDYADALVVKRRTGRDRPAGRADEAGQIEELIELVQVLGMVDIAVPPGLADRLAEQFAAQAQAEEQATAQAACASAPLRVPVATRSPGFQLDARVPPRKARSLRSLFELRFLAASTAVFLTAALIVFDLRQSPLSAAELLRHSADVARVAESRPGVVVHRVMRLEQRDPSSGKVIDRRDIEIWERADRGVKARRAYDERHRLVAGEWKRGGALRAVYASAAGGHNTATSSAEELEAQTERAALDARSVWQLDVSAADFLALLPDPRRARVTTTPTMYIVAYEAPVEASGLVRASITLRKDGLWPVRQTLVVNESGALSEFRFEEATLERLPEKRVSAKVFEPDPGLWDEKVEPPPAPKARVTPPPVPAPPVVVPVDTGRLLLNAWFRVHRLDACLDDRTVIALQDGHVAVHAMVADEERRALLVRAFDSFAPLDRLQLEVETAVGPRTAADAPGDEEAAAPAAATAGVSSPAASAPERAPDPLASGEATADARTPESGARAAARVGTVRRGAAWAPVREHFRRRVGFLPEQEVGPQLDVATDQFTAWVIERSTRRMQEARALGRHLAPWSAERLASLDLDARAAWIAMLRQHARAFRQETELLRVQLQTVFVPIGAPAAEGEGGGMPDDAGAASVEAGVTDAQLVHLSERLIQLAEQEDAIIAAAFLPEPATATAAAAAPLRTADIEALVQGLAQAERLASRFDAPQWLDR
jgi:hypothetical protein